MERQQWRPVEFFFGGANSMPLPCSAVASAARWRLPLLSSLPFSCCSPAASRSLGHHCGFRFLPPPRQPIRSLLFSANRKTGPTPASDWPDWGSVFHQRIFIHCCNTPGWDRSASSVTQAHRILKAIRASGSKQVLKKKTATVIHAPGALRGARHMKREWLRWPWIDSCYAWIHPLPYRGVEWREDAVPGHP